VSFITSYLGKQKLVEVLLQAPGPGKVQAQRANCVTFHPVAAHEARKTERIEPAKAPDDEHISNFVQIHASRADCIVLRAEVRGGVLIVVQGAAAQWA
jgi:hypothetical protein